MKLLQAFVATAALACVATGVHAFTLVGSTVDGVLSSNQTPGVTTQFQPSIVAPGTFNGVMTDVFNQTWDVNVGVLANSITVSFDTPANANGNISSNGLLDIALSNFTGLPPVSLASYSCLPAGSFACGAFGPGPSVRSLVGTATTVDIGFDIMRTGETYTFAFAVPEPGTWAMMLIGFGLIGGAARWSRRARSAPIA